MRDLGSSYFPTTVFAADEEEVLSEHVWRERESDVLSASGSDKVAEEKRKEMMGEQERELYALRRAENETRNLRRRDIGIGGSIGMEGGAGDGEAGGARGVPFPVGEGVEDALKGLETEGNVVRLVRRFSILNLNPMSCPGLRLTSMNLRAEHGHLHRDTHSHRHGI